MHAEKVRTAYIPSFRLEPREVMIIMGFVGVAAYLLGFIIGMMN